MDKNGKMLEELKEEEEFMNLDFENFKPRE